MSRGLTGFMKGIGTGIAAGMTIAAISGALMKNNKSMRKNAGKAIKAVGDLIDNVQYMVK